MPQFELLSKNLDCFDVKIHHCSDSKNFVRETMGEQA